MKYIKSFSFISYIFIVLFNFSYQITENNIINLENKPFNENQSFKLVINYPNQKLLKNVIDIKIESEIEDLNNYYYKYYYVKENKNIILDDIEYYNEPNKTLELPEVKYIICEINNKINNNKIYLKSEVINYNSIKKKEIDNKYTFTNISFNDFKDNNFSLIIFFSTFCFATTISVVLISFDLKDDNKIVKTYNLSTKDRAYKEYQNLKNSFINKNIFKYACFLMKYTYSIFNIITIYNYDHPRYIRFFIVIIKIVSNIFFSMLFFFIYKHFGDEKKKPIDGVLSFLFSVFSSIIIYIISLLITKKYLGYDKIRRDIWKPKIESLRKYIYYTVKKDILFNSKWHNIRNRMISYTRICGKIILRDKPEDKYKIYADNKQKCYKEELSIKTPSESSNNSLIGDDKDSERYDEKFMANTFNIKTKINNNLLGYNMRRKKTFFAKTNEKDLNLRLYVEKGVQSFSISKFGQNDLKLKTVQKIEDIRNRYILNINDSKFDETLEVNSFVKTYDNLEIETLENYTYISTDSMNNQLHKTSSESNKIFINLIATLIVLLLLTLVDFGLISIYLLMEEFETNLIYYYCLIPILCQITIFNFIWNYFFNLIISVIIFNRYGYEKKNCFYKIFFKLFIEKYIKYIYKIRLLINKYNKELEFFDK